MHIDDASLASATYDLPELRCKPIIFLRFRFNVPVLSIFYPKHNMTVHPFTFVRDHKASFLSGGIKHRSMAADSASPLPCFPEFTTLIKRTGHLKHRWFDFSVLAIIIIVHFLLASWNQIEDQPEADTSVLQNSSITMHSLFNPLTASFKLTNFQLYGTISLILYHPVKPFQ